jgi:hypothetical protein
MPITHYDTRPRPGAPHVVTIIVRRHARDPRLVEVHLPSPDGTTYLTNAPLGPDLIQAIGDAVLDNNDLTCAPDGALWISELVRVFRFVNERDFGQGVETAIELIALASVQAFLEGCACRPLGPDAYEDLTSRSLTAIIESAWSPSALTH